MAREMIAKREVPAPFIGHHRGFFRDVGFNKQMHRLKHLVQRDMRRLENRADFHRELLAAIWAWPGGAGRGEARPGVARLGEARQGFLSRVS